MGREYSVVKFKGHIILRDRGNKYCFILEELALKHNPYSLSVNGEDFILEYLSEIYYFNSGERVLYSIDKVCETLKEIEDTPYRSQKVKDKSLSNWKTIFNILKRYERQKKLDSIL
jgi:hypothetical protein